MIPSPKKIFQNEYAGKIITIITGTSLAQAVPIAISPILTRIYSPDDFGVFAIFAGFVSIMSVLVTGRYDLAILLPKRDNDAFHIAALSVGLSVLVSVFLQLLLFVFWQDIIILLKLARVGQFLPLIPLSTMLMGVFTSLNYWNHRKANYRRLAITRVTQSACSASAQIGGGFLPAGGSGLIFGQIIGQLITVGYLVNTTLIEDLNKIKVLCRYRVFLLSQKYLNFPRFLIIAHVLNTASGQVPVLLFGSLISTSAAGNYILVQRVMGAPMALIANAIGDVFRQEASRTFAQNGNCYNIYIATLKRLIICALPPFGLFFLLAPLIVRTVFGERWAQAAEYAQIMCPMYFFQFVTSPLSSMFIIAGKQKEDLLWQIALFLLTASAFLIGARHDDQNFSIKFFSFAYSVMYLLNGVMTYKFSACKNKIK